MNDLLQIIALVAALNGNTHQPNTQHQPNYLGPTFTVADRCGWYERMERTPTHDVYHRFDNCTNSLIGQRWVRRY